MFMFVELAVYRNIVGLLHGIDFNKFEFKSVARLMASMLECIPVECG